MVTKQEVRDYYAKNRKDSNVGMCPPIVKGHLDNMVEDDIGLYAVSSQLIDGPRAYYTLEMVKEEIRRAIGQYIRDLLKVAEI
jgi:hypothetical protein